MDGKIRELGVLHARRAQVFARCATLSGVGAAMGQMKEVAYLDGQIAKLRGDIANGESQQTAGTVSPKARRKKQEIASEMIEKIIANGGAKGGESRDWWAKKLEEEGLKVSPKTVSRCPAFKSLNESRKEAAFRRAEAMKMRGQLYEYN